MPMGFAWVLGTLMIRPVVPNDTEALVRLADETTFFKPREIVAVPEKSWTITMPR